MSYAKYNSLGIKPAGPSSSNFELYSLKDNDEKQQAIMKNRVCIIDVYGDWCGPCKLIEPKVGAVA